jgi:hypothetical protein
MLHFLYVPLSLSVGFFFGIRYGAVVAAGLRSELHSAVTYIHHLEDELRKKL